MRRTCLSLCIAALGILSSGASAAEEGRESTPARPSVAEPEGPVIPAFLRSVTKRKHEPGAWGAMDFTAASPLVDVGFSPDGQTVYAASKSGEVVGWDLGRFLASWTLQASSDAEQGATLAVSPEGRLLLTPLRRPPSALDVGGHRVRKLEFPPECGEGRCAGGGLGTFFVGQGMAVAGRDTVLVWRFGEEVARVDHPRMKEGESFSAITGSPTEELLGLGTELGRLVIWDLKTLKVVKQGAAHAGRVFGAQFFASGKQLATAGADGVLKLWDARKGTMLKSLRLIERAARLQDAVKIEAVAFSPDGRLVLIAAQTRNGQGSELCLWNVETGKRLWRAQDLRTRAIAFSADSRRAALAVHEPGADEPRRLIVLEVEAGPSVMRQQAHQQRVTGVSVSPDGAAAISAGLEGAIKRWDGTDAAAKLVGQQANGTSDLAVGWERQQALSRGADGAIRIWAIKASELQGALAPELIPGRPGPISAKATEPDPHALIVSPDDRRALIPVSDQPCASPDKGCPPSFKLRKWDLQQSKALRDLYFGERPVPRPPCAVFLPERDEVLVGFDAAPLKIYVRDPEGVPVRSFADPEADVLRTLVLQPAGDLVLVGADRLGGPADDRKRGGATLWNWRTGKKVRALAGHLDSVVSAAFSGDGQRLLTASLDGTIRLWDVASGRELEQLDLKAIFGDVPTAISAARGAATVMVGTQKGALLQFQLRR